ncbi:hypothetical protein HHI36_016444, partial [Cryptolaemus montrouzieri]
ILKCNLHHVANFVKFSNGWIGTNSTNDALYALNDPGNNNCFQEQAFPVFVRAL